MGSTTIKVSTETRERLRVLGGATCEEAIVAALDALEAGRFWSQAEAAAAHSRRLSAEQRRQRSSAAAEVDAAFAGIE
ncbi:MAG: hypothetical protein Q7V88_00070 [Actinomycetota bacterium]|nr:hypothetical protein [Actinomycetota bacterium]